MWFLKYINCGLYCMYYNKLPKQYVNTDTLQYNAALICSSGNQASRHSKICSNFSTIIMFYSKCLRIQIELNDSIRVFVSQAVSNQSQVLDTGQTKLRKIVGA
jgi:hypothetical protein